MEPKRLFLHETGGGSSSSPPHEFGYGFSCLRLFRAACGVAPGRRRAWCRERRLDPAVLDSVRDFVTKIHRKLNPSADDNVSLAFDRSMSVETVERCLVRLFLESFINGLAVFSGSTHCGYLKVTGAVVKATDAIPSPAPKFALFFKLRRPPSPTCGGATCKVTLFVPEDLAREHVETRDTGFTEGAVEKLYNSAHVCTVKVPAMLLKRLFGHPEGVAYFGRMLDPWNLIGGAHVEPNMSDNSVTVHKLDSSLNEEAVESEIRKAIEKEKMKLLNEVAFFEYPEKGSGILLQVLNTGKVKEIKDHSEEASLDKNNTVLVYVCCNVLGDLLKWTLEKYECGEVERCMTEEEEKLTSTEPRLWGRVLCRTDAARKTLLAQHPPPNAFLCSARPDLRSDATSVDYVRATVRHVAAPVKYVEVRRVCGAKSPPPPPPYVVVLNEPCKMWWDSDEEGVFELNFKYVTNNQILKGVKAAFGDGLCSVKITRDPWTTHRCFERETTIKSRFIDALPDVNPIRYHVTAVPEDPGSDLRDTFVDFFSGGKEFIAAYRKLAKTDARKWNWRPWIHQVEFCSAVLVKPEVLERVQEGIDVLRERIEEKNLGVEMTSSRNSAGMTVMQVRGRDEKRVGTVKNVLLKVISPDVIHPGDSGNPLALPYLRSWGGRKFLEKLESKFSATFTFQSSGTDSLLVYGPPKLKPEARAAVLTHVDNLSEPATIPVQPELRILLVKKLKERYGQDFTDLCRQTGADAVFWDSKSGHFAVWGHPDCVEACRARVAKVSDELGPCVSTVDSGRPTCVACLCLVEGLPFTLGLCAHAYCESCIEAHVTIAVQDRSLPVTCVAPGCEEPILLNDLGKSCHYSQKGLRQLLNASLSLFIAQQGDSSPVRYCPTADCSNVYFVSKEKFTGDETTCKLCHVAFCNHCGASPYHVGYTCALWASREHVDAETAAWFGEDAVLRRLCPRCGVGIEKAEGCFNVHCSNCKASVCFKCGQSFEESQACYNHLTNVHGSYY